MHPNRREFFFPLDACTIICDMVARCIPAQQVLKQFVHTCELYTYYIEYNASVGGNYTLSCHSIECTYIEITVHTRLIIVIIRDRKVLVYLHTINE